MSEPTPEQPKCNSCGGLGEVPNQFYPCDVQCPACKGTGIGQPEPEKPPTDQEIYIRVLESRYTKMKSIADQIVTVWEGNTPEWADRMDKLCHTYRTNFLPPKQKT